MHVVLIPAFEPDARLVALVRELAADGPVVVVDDGSGRRFADVFAQAAAAGALVCTHPRNRGKGAALRTGFAFVAQTWPAADVVTADADGQHTPADIRRVAAAIGAGVGAGGGAAASESLAVVAGSASTNPPQLPARLTHHTPGGESLALVTASASASQPRLPPKAAPAIVLGVRSFTAAAIPLRSRVGNVATRWAFRVATGQSVHDTQTGLRGYPAALLPWLQTLPGDRFEYEFTTLLRADAAGVGLVEVPISTVYLDGNRSSHFRPLADSLRVYGPLLRFTASALLAFGIDTVALLVLNTATGWLLFSVVAARLLSATVNYTVNRAHVFAGGRELPTRTSAARYFSLAALLLAANYGVLSALMDAGVPVLVAKVLTEAALFLVSYSVQRAVVFAPAAGMKRGAGSL
ncbi:MAG: bifunctional glycosyltransferase family 2/GtrA family protein [Microbacterium sp.]